MPMKYLFAFFRGLIFLKKLNNPDVKLQLLFFK